MRTYTMLILLFTLHTFKIFAVADADFMFPDEYDNLMIKPEKLVSETTTLKDQMETVVLEDKILIDPGCAAGHMKILGRCRPSNSMLSFDMSTALVSTFLAAFCLLHCNSQYAPYPYPYHYPFHPFPGFQNPYQYRYPPYPIQKQPFFPYPPTEIIDVPEIPMVNDTFPGLPTEIIDMDSNEIIPEISTPEPTETSTSSGAATISPYISGTSVQHYSSNINNTKGIHIYESKPINTVIRRTIHSNGKDGRNVLNIHVVNGIEVTSLDTPIITYEEHATTEHSQVVSAPEEEESEEEEDTNKDDGADPKPVLGWFH